MCNFIFSLSFFLLYAKLPSENNIISRLLEKKKLVFLLAIVYRIILDFKLSLGTKSMVFRKFSFEGYIFSISSPNVAVAFLLAPNAGDSLPSSDREYLFSGI